MTSVARTASNSDVQSATDAASGTSSPTSTAYPHLALPTPRGAAGSTDASGLSAQAEAAAFPLSHALHQAFDGAGGGQGAGPMSTQATRANRTSDGYTVEQCIADMKRVQSRARREPGPHRSDAQLRVIAEGIVAGVNKNFPASKYGSPTRMAQTLIASAWKESKFNTHAGNGGVFQCAQNRLADYNRAHGTHFREGDLSGGNPQRAIDISLWAMAHPARSVTGRSVGGTAIPKNPNEAALYYWNYNPREIADYMRKTRYFRSVM